jgi:aminoglycoside phosphotransferase (APT) family kinase protein
MMEREVQLMGLIRNRTTAPVPEVLDYSTSHDDILGYPYILMTKLPGQCAASIWLDQPYDPGNDL